MGNHYQVSDLNAEYQRLTKTIDCKARLQGTRELKVKLLQILVLSKPNKREKNRILHILNNLSPN